MQSQDRLRVALLAAYAIGLHGLERLIPTPIPWLRFGFANIITLTVLVLYGFRVSMTITLIRVLMGSLFSGTFLGPGFVLSLGGGIASTSIMAAVHSASRAFSPVGLSLLGALFHNIAQLGLAYLLFVRRIEAILLITPLILLIGIITGGINGTACSLLLKRLRGSAVPGIDGGEAEGGRRR